MTIYETQTLRAAQYAADRADSFSFQWLRNGADIGSGSILLAITANPAATVTVTEPAPATFVATAQGYSSLLWQVSVTGTGGWSDIVGATSLTYTIPSTDFEIHDGLFYRMSATDGTTTVYTTASALTVNEGGGITQVPANNYPDGFTVPMDEIWEITGAITTPKSIEVHGTLKMRGVNNPSITFIGVNEQGMIGSVKAPGVSGTPITDVGLWIHEMGTLDIQGTPKTSWTHLAAGAVIGALTITLEAVPTNWAVGDWIAIAPMEPFINGDTNATKTAKGTPEDRRIKAINGAVITLGSFANATVAQGLLKNHPTYTYHDGFVAKAEVLNLTRDCNINGTAGHRSHIMIHSQAPVHCSWFGMDYMGPNTGTDVIVGRWAFHQHLNADYSRGTIIEGAVVTHGGTHCFVAHGAHGVTHQDCIAHDCFASAFWWDHPGGGGNQNPDQTLLQSYFAVDRTQDYVGDRCVASFLHPLSQHNKTQALAGFEMLAGTINTALYPKQNPPPTFSDHRNQFTNCVAISCGDAGFFWNNIGPGGTWNIHGCVAHHNQRAHAWWTNVPKNEHSTTFRTFYNVDGTRNGAYVNDSSWSDSFFESSSENTTWEDHAGSKPITYVATPPYELAGKGRRIIRCVLKGGPGMSALALDWHLFPPQIVDVMFIDCTFVGGAGAIGAIHATALTENWHAYSIIRPTFVLPTGVPAFWFDDQPHMGEWVELRNHNAVSDNPANLTYIVYDNGTNVYKLWNASKTGAAAAGYTFITAWNCWRQTIS